MVANVSCCLTWSPVPPNLVFSVADNLGSSEMQTVCQITCVYMIYKPGSQQHIMILFIKAFELPTLSVMSEVNGQGVYTIYNLS